MVLKCRLEISLLSDDHAFEVFFDAFQECFSYFVCYGKKRFDISAVFSLRWYILFGIFFLLLGEISNFQDLWMSTFVR